MSIIQSKISTVAFTTSLNEIVLFSRDEYVDVTIASGPDEILSERYYTHGGVTRVSDLTSLINEYMERDGLSYAELSLNVESTTGETDSHIFKLIYSSRSFVCTNIPEYLRNNFLITPSFHRMVPGENLSIPYYAEAGETIGSNTEIKYRMKGSDAIRCQRILKPYTDTVKTDGITSVTIDWNSLIHWAADEFDEDRNDVEMLLITVRVHKRAITLVPDYSLKAEEQFYFRNAFNVWDWVVLPMMTTESTEISTSQANVNGSVMLYDQEAVKTYESETGALASTEEEWLTEFFTSHEQRRRIANPYDDTEPVIFVPVLITECRCEMELGDEPNTASFKWRYTDRLPYFSLPAPQEIFSFHYNRTFS